MLVAISVIGVVVVAAIVGFAAYSMGIFAAEAIDGGPRSVIFWALVTAFSVGAAYSFLGLIAAEMAGLRNPIPVMVLVGGATAALSLIMPVQTLLTARKEGAYLLQMAPKVTAFGLAHFDAIDSDGDGIMTESEMEAAMRRWSDDDEWKLFRHMFEQRSELGHVVDSSSDMTFIWIYDGNGGSTMTPVTNTTYYYGISRCDLQGYTVKVTKKYSRW